MMQCVDKAIAQNKIALIEGGTGIGKTFGYLIPAILKQTHGLKIIIATATISLQEQLLHKDISALEQLLGLKVNAKMAKGRRRYVCHRQLNDYHFQSTQGELFMFGIDDKPPVSDEKDKTQVTRLQRDLTAGTWDGDRDNLTEVVKDSLWSRLTLDASRCTNSKCAFFHRCAFFKARKELAFADIIITNHDLLLSDLKLGSGVLLPALEQSIIVIDEAHHLPAKALDHFSAKIDLMGFVRMLEALQKNLNMVKDVSRLDEHLMVDLASLVALQKQQMMTLFDFLANQYRAYEKDGHWTLFALPDALSEQLSPLLVTATKLLHGIGRIKRTLSKSEHDASDHLLQQLSLWGFMEELVSQCVSTLQMYLTVPDQDTAPIAKWIQARSFSPGHARKVVDYALHATVVSAAKSLTEALWAKRTNAVVLCSATLRALGKFDNFINQVGLTGVHKMMTYHVPSPFPYEKSRVVIPKMQYTPEGAMAKQHAEDVTKKLAKLLGLDKAGTLVLFTSKWMMESVYATLPASISNHILKQGGLSKYQLLIKHKGLIDSGEQSIIFGLESFAQGVDLPGQYCNHVIITKLPFKVPTTPIEKTRARWLEQTGKNPFMLHALPDASIRLTQYVGRLVRCVSDVGKVTILDRRILTKFYGKFLLQNLPNFTQEIE